MRGAPAVECTGCGFVWHSQAMAEGLRLMGSCPRCGGELAFRDAVVTTAEPVVADVAPHQVLGRPVRR